MKRPKIYKTKQQKEIDKKLAGFSPELLRLAENAKPMPRSGAEMVRTKDKNGKPITYKF